MGIPVWYPRWWMDLGLMKEENLDFHQWVTVGLLGILAAGVVLFVAATPPEANKIAKILNGRIVCACLIGILLVSVIGAIPILELSAVGLTLWFVYWLVNGTIRAVKAAFGRVE